MAREKAPLYANVLELMKVKAARVHASPRAQKGLVELGDLLQLASDISPQDNPVIIRTLLEIVDTLSSEGDERNARAYLVTLSDAFRRT